MSTTSRVQSNEKISSEKKEWTAKGLDIVDCLRFILICLALLGNCTSHSELIDLDNKSYFRFFSQDENLFQPLAITTSTSLEV